MESSSDLIWSVPMIKDQVDHAMEDVLDANNCFLIHGRACRCSMGMQGSSCASCIVQLATVPVQGSNPQGLNTGLGQLGFPAP
jgi:hypothetical protein